MLGCPRQRGDLVEPGHAEQLVDLGWHRGQRQMPAVSVHDDVAADQLGDTNVVDVADAGEIQHQTPATPFNEVSHPILQTAERVRRPRNSKTATVPARCSSISMSGAGSAAWEAAGHGARSPRICSGVTVV